MASDTPLEMSFENVMVNDTASTMPKAAARLGAVKIHRDVLSQKQDIESLGPAKIFDVKCVASYNWIRKDRVTMLIPGAPPVWNQSSSTCNGAKTEGMLENGSGAAYNSVHQNDCKNGWLGHPLEPVIYAASLMDSTFELMNFDIVTDATAMECMLAFIAPEPKPLTLEVELANGTLFIANRGAEPYSDSYHPMADGTFLWEDCVKGSTCHHRVLSYVFGGQRILLTCSSHGYLPAPAEEAASGEKRGNEPAMKEQGSLDAPRIGALAKEFPVAHRGGKNIPQEAIVDLKCYEASNNFPPSNADIKRLWIRQVPNIILEETGPYQAGVHDATRLTHEWEQNMQANLEKLAVLLSKLRSYANQSTSKKLLIRRMKHPKGPEFLSVDEHDVAQSISPAILNYNPASIDKASSSDKDGKMGIINRPKNTKKGGEAKEKCREIATVSKSSSLESIPLTDWEVVNDGDGDDMDWVEVDKPGRKSKARNLPN